MEGKNLTFSGPNKDFEGIKKIDENGIEYWEARELMPILGYKKWQNAEEAVKRAIIACKNSGQDDNYHFTAGSKMVVIAKNTKREAKRKINDFHLSRYACYLIAQNGNPRKAEIALAQTYFAIQTRKQELFEALGADEKRLMIRKEVRDQNRKLFATAKEAGVSNFGKFNNYGNLGLYGMNSSQIKKKKNLGKDDILDRAGATELAANLFRITQTDEKISKEKIKGESKANNTHLAVGKKVRKTIAEIGGTMPEDLLPETHVKMLGKNKRKLLK